MTRSILLLPSLALGLLLASCADNRMENAAAITSSGSAAIHGTFRQTGAGSTLTVWPEGINGSVVPKPKQRADQGAFPVKTGTNRIMVRADTTRYVGVAKLATSRTTIDFSARPGVRYAVNGDWTSDGLFVWIEEGDTGKTVAPKRELKPVEGTVIFVP
ncbi:hypothetical protein OKA04_20670 [Luteolibacter flavescens]|uniref:Lipoprotein n=1 Tax=Luteolibacter flavescens TaxID=1859460 RepID=A0ABT3FUA2_9BACT|nr:hypothetical protein [Luteolibacter flavescens]MCW1887165.1 hypothetical protein [Luteolibacter flavescens]